MEAFDRKRKRSEESSDISTFQMPPGFMFEPTEQELIAHYLLKKVTGMSLPLDCFVHNFNVYGSSEPWEIWQMFGGLEKQKGDNMDLFFFTQLKRVSTGKNSSKNFVRKVGAGTWFHESTTAVFDYNEESQIGSKKRFRYENKKTPEQQGLWNMMEFTLEDSYLLKYFPKLPTDIVLCRIRYNYEKGRKRMLVKTGKEQMVVGDNGNVVTTETTNNGVLDGGIIQEEMVDEGEIMALLSTDKEEKEAGKRSEVGTEVASLAKELLDWSPSDAIEEEFQSLQQRNCYQSFAELLS